MQHALIDPNPLVVSAETRFMPCSPGSERRDWLESGNGLWWNSVESSDLVLDGQLVSRDTVKSIGPTALNKYPNTQNGEKMDT